jgi:hypothetical protein
MKVVYSEVFQRNNIKTYQTKQLQQCPLNWEMRRNEKLSTKRQKWKEKCTHKRLETRAIQKEKCKTLMQRHKQRQRGLERLLVEQMRDKCKCKLRVTEWLLCLLSVIGLTEPCKLMWGSTRWNNFTICNSTLQVIIVW